MGDEKMKPVVEAGPPGTTTSKDPPVIWIGNPQTRKAKPAWKMDHADEHIVNGQVRKSYYGGDFLVSPDSGSLFFYSTLGNGYIVNIDSGQEQDLGTVTGKLRLWAQQGIVTQNSSVIRLLSTSGEEKGLIRFSVLLP